MKAREGAQTRPVKRAQPVVDVMLVSNGTSPATELCLFSGHVGSFQSSTIACPKTQEMLELFEQATGWVVERKASEQPQADGLRRSSNSKNGRLTIVDMSTDWPARKPTAHRAKCDDLVKRLDWLVDELQQTKSSLLDAEQQLKLIHEQSGRVFSANTDSSALSEIPFRRSTGSTAQAVDPPFEGWRLAGAAGVTADRFIDWRLSHDERIELLVGEIATDKKDNEFATFTVDPLTHEFSLSGNSNFNVLLYDHSDASLSKIECVDSWRQLGWRQMVIVSTSNELMAWVDSGKKVLLSNDVARVSQEISEIVGDDESFLVLKQR